MFVSTTAGIALIVVGLAVLLLGVHTAGKLSIIFVERFLGLKLSKNGRRAVYVGGPALIIFVWLGANSTLV